MGLFFLHLWHVGPTLKSQLISNSFLIPSADMCGGNIQLSGSTGEHSPFCTQAAPPEAQLRPLPAAPFVEGFTLHLPLSQGFGLHIKAKLTQDSPNQSSCPLHCQWSLTVLGTTLFWKSRGDLGILRSPSHRLGGGRQHSSCSSAEGHTPCQATVPTTCVGLELHLCLPLPPHFTDILYFLLVDKYLQVFTPVSLSEEWESKKIISFFTDRWMFSKVWW